MCFEKLDVTAKVLPCQHTFCKPCLQRIFKAHKELRCPECRTLVFCSIEALPANLLLVRLLDGVRSGQNSWKGGSFRRPRILTLQDNRKTKTSSRSLQASPFRLVPSVRIHMDGVRENLLANIMCVWRLGMCMLRAREQTTSFMYKDLHQSAGDDSPEWARGAMITLLRRNGNSEPI